MEKIWVTYKFSSNLCYSQRFWSCVCQLELLDYFSQHLGFLASNQCGNVNLC